MRKIRKAVIPAAGNGTRFQPFTYGSPKEMFPIIDKPTIHYVVDEAKSVGVTDILIVTGSRKGAIEDYFENNPEFAEDVRIHTTRQHKPLGLGHAVLCAKDHVGDDPFLLLLGDDITVGEETASRTLIDAYAKTGESVVSVQTVPDKDVSKFGIIKPGATLGGHTFLVDDLVEKPALENAPSNLAIVGRYLLTPGIFGCIEKTAPDKKNEIQLTDALRKYKESNPLYARRFDGERYDLGSKNDAFRMTVEMALRRPDMREYAMKVLGSEKVRRLSK